MPHSKEMGRVPFYQDAMRVISFRLPRHIADYIKKKGGGAWLRLVIENIIKKEG
jgi:hypothetical protein